MPHLAMSLWCRDVTFHLLTQIIIPEGSWGVWWERLLVRGSSIEDFRWKLITSDEVAYVGSF